MRKLSEFSHNTLVMMTGTIGAQAIGILASPILTRIYSPSDFGVYALFVSIFTLLSVFICGRYEFAITLPKSDDDALAIVALCSLVSFVLSLLSIPIVLLLGDSLVAVLGEPTLKNWLWILPGASFISGIATAARYWFIRTKQFKTVSINAVTRALVTSICNILIGIWGLMQFGLVGGLLTGLFFSSIWLLFSLWNQSKESIRQISWLSIKTQAKLHQSLPKYSTGTALIESSSSQTVIFLMSSLFGSATLGHYSLAHRMANLPITIVAGSISDVFRQQASECYGLDGECRTLFISTLKKLCLIAVPGFTFLAVFAPYLFKLVFGTEWHESGVLVQLLIFSLTLRFITFPLSSMFFIAGKQKSNLAIHGSLFISLLIAFWLVAKFGLGSRTAVGAYSAIYGIKYIIQLILSYKYSKGISSNELVR